jgi:hypothetical protein
MKQGNAKTRIVPIFLIISILLAITISSEGEKQIDINLEFSNSTNYDPNNDGIESINSVVDLTVQNTKFNWNVNEDKLLTKWKITNEDKETTNICYGNPEGCSFVDLTSASENWNDIFYVNYDKDGAGYTNKIESQVIYYNVELESNIIEIYDSKYDKKDVKFYDEESKDLSNLKVTIKNKNKEDIGNYNIVENEDSYDLTISNKKDKSNSFGVVSATVSAKDSLPESKVEIRKIKNIKDVKAVIDKSTDDLIQTDILAINDSNLQFETAQITLAKHGQVDAILRCENFNFETLECTEWQTTDIEFVDNGDTVTFTVTGFSAYGGTEINIIDLHSYPPLYGNWTVRFTTAGTADLKIRAVNGTTWTNTGDVGSGYDLKFLGLKCGEDSIDYQWINDEAVIENYECSEISYETQKELTTGAHYLEYEFGDNLAYAENNVGAITLTGSIVEKGSSVIASSSGDCGQWSISAGASYCSISGSSCYATVTGVAVGNCTIRLVNSTGGDPQTTTLTVQDTTAPSADYTVTAYDYPGDQWENGIVIKWNDSSSNDVFYYTVHRAENSPNGGTNLTTIAGNSSQSYEINDTYSNDSTKIFYYGVTACDDQFNCNQVWSDATSVNAQPIQMLTVIKHLDESLVLGDNKTTEIMLSNILLNPTTKIATTTDNIKCVGVAHDIDNESLSMVYNITIRETYGQGSNIQLNGILDDCVYFDSDVWGWQNENYNFTEGTTFCEININSSLTSKGDKIDCSMSPYDGDEYGTAKSSQTAYINNTAPFASGVGITPSNPNESSTLVCNYTYFNDIDVGDTENVSGAKFKWYINNEGLNDFIEINGETSRDLSTTFDKDDIVMCAVMVKDLDIGWLKGPLWDDEYVNGSSVTIVDNAKPQIIDYFDNSNETYPTTEGSSVTFDVEWADYEDAGESAQMYVCSENTVAETSNENGTDNLEFGNSSDMIYYTNLTGTYVETIGIKPWKAINSIGGNLTNGTTGYLYDIYAFEVDNVGDAINSTATMIAYDHNNAFTIGKYNYISLQYNAQPLPTKHLALMFCVDTDDDDTTYCGTDMSSTDYTLSIKATDVTGTNLGNINTTNTNTSENRSYADANIKINYMSTAGGNVSSNGCIGTQYCQTSISSDTEIDCSYTTSKDYDDERSNDYYVKVCDDEDACSVWRRGTFWVNYKAQMNLVNLTTTKNNTDSNQILNFTSDSNLNCTHNATDTWIKSGYNNGNLSYTYKWYYDRGDVGIFTYYSTAPTANILAQSNTQEGDKWLCEVTPNDGFMDGTPSNASYVNIGSNSSSSVPTDGTPAITNIIDNSNSINPSAEGSTITFNISWADANSSSLSAIYICNTTSVTTTGCTDAGEFGRSTGTISSNPIEVSFTAQSKWGENQTAYVYIYDDTWILSNAYVENFTINHKPNLTTFTIDYTSASSLSCNYVVAANNQNELGDIDDELNISLSEFKWWKNGAIQAQTTQNITAVSIPENNWICGVQVYDNHGLASSNYINSSIFYGTDTIIAPIIQNLPSATKESSINIIGYLNKSNYNLNVTSIARQNGSFVNISSQWLRNGNNTLYGSALVYQDSSAGNSYIRISEDYLSYFVVNRSVEFTNHNKTNFEKYKISAVVNLYDLTHRIDFNSALESNVIKDEVMYIYNNITPTGWFNLSQNLFPADNEVKVRGYENVSTEVLTGLPTTFNIYYDPEEPIINTTLTRTSSNVNAHTIYFKVSDNYKLNLSTLLLNITNGTYNVTHRYDNLFYNNESLNWGDNIVCSGNTTFQNCNASINLNDGNYTLTFSVNDSVTWNTTSTISDYIVDSSSPEAPTIYVKSIQNTTNLSLMWHDSSSNITFFEYAVGTARNPDNGWDSILEWTNATEVPLIKLVDSDNDNYPDENETWIRSVDRNISSDDIVNKTGNASLRNFQTDREMYYCGDDTEFKINCSIVLDINGDFTYDYFNDTILYNGSPITNLSSLKNFTTNFTYSDSDHNNNYTTGEAIIVDGNLDLQLNQGNLTGISTDTVIVNATTSSLFIPLTTTNLNLTNHNFYYVSIRYKTDENLFYSLIGSSLTIKYKITSGGGGETEDNCTGPTNMHVNASLVSEIEALNATWNESTDECYTIDRYEYSIGTSAGDTSTLSWTSAMLNTTAISTNDLTDANVYYWNVKAINSIGQESSVASSVGTTYYDQIAPDVNITQVANDTNFSDNGWIDVEEDSVTAITLVGDENMTCFISPYDKGYSNFNSDNDTWASVNSSTTMNFTLYNLIEGTHTYSIVCTDFSTPTPNQASISTNEDITFTLDWPSVPEVTVPQFNQSSYLLGDSIRINTTYTDQDNNTGTVYVMWYVNQTYLMNTTQESVTNGTVITSEINSTDFTRNDVINVTVSATDSTGLNSTVQENSISLSNTAPTITTIILNSTNLENKTAEDLECHVISATDVDGDELNYTYKWFNNSILELIINNTNETIHLLNNSNTSKGENWTCEVTPYDGTSDGNSLNSTILTIANTDVTLTANLTNISFNNDLKNAINLNSYFSDVDGDNISYTVSGNTQINVTIGDDGIVNLSSTISTLESVSFTANSSLSSSVTSNTIQINATNNTIVVSLDNPIDYYNSSNLTVTFNCSANNTRNINLTNATLNIYNSTDELLYNITTNTNVENSTNMTFSYTFTSDGVYTWNCQFEDNQSNTGTTANDYTLTIDTTETNISFSSGTLANDTIIPRTWIYSDVTLSGDVKTITWNINDTETVYNSTTYNHNQTSLGNGTYNYNVTVCDYANNCNSTETRVITLTTSLPATISNVVNTSTSTTSTITWDTDVQANSTVFYGTNQSNLNMSVSSPTLTTSHSISLSNLIAETNYSYVVSSTTIYGVEINSSEYNFTTSTIVAGGSTSSSSGGGGGGSSSSDTTVITLSNSYKGADFSRNDRLSFEYNNRYYEIKIVKIGDTYVDGLVVNTKELFKLNLGAEKELDLDSDGKGDIQIKLTKIEKNKADILIKTAKTLEPLRIIKLPKTVTQPEGEVFKPTPRPVIQPEPEEPIDDQRELIPYSIAVITALALVGGLVMKEKMRVDYISQQHELMLPIFIHKAKKKGHDIKDISDTLIKKGWPKRMVASASLHGAISLLQKQGHDHSSIRKTLKGKGFSTKVVNDAIVTHHINKELKKRRSIKKIRKELLDAGWNQKTVHKKLPPKV